MRYLQNYVKDVPEHYILRFILAEPTPVGYTGPMNDTPLTLPAAPAPVPARALTAAEFRGLAEVPPELEWFANITNPRTRRAYPQDVRDFTAFVGIARPEAFRTVTRAHLIACGRIWKPEIWRRRPSVASWPRWRRCSTICASTTRCRTIRRTG